MDSGKAPKGATQPVLLDASLSLGGSTKMREGGLGFSGVTPLDSGDIGETSRLFQLS